MSSRLEAEDLAAIRPIGAANWSPDGTRLAYIQADGSGVSRLRIVSADGQQLPQATDTVVVVEMSDGTDRRDVAGGPQWSPDGKSIAFLRPSSSGPVGLCVLDVAARTTRELTAGSDRTPRWSPDGRELVFVRHRDGHDDLHRVAASGGPSLQLTYGHYDNNDPAWASDGRWIAFSSQRSDVDVFSSSLCIVPARGGEVTRLTNDDRANDRAPRWSSDSTTIAFISNREDTDEVWLTSPAGGEPRRLTSGPGDKGDPQWSPDGGQVAFTRTFGMNIDIAVIALEGAGAALLTGGGVNGSPRWSADGRRIAFIHSSTTEPKEVWVQQLAPARQTQLTHSAEGKLKPDISWSIPQLISVRADDGVSTEALLYPATSAIATGVGIVFVHEGPNNVQANGWEGLIQFLAQRGYTVIAPNYRGSTGYGRSFMEANALDRAGVDLLDWAAAARHLATLDSVDPKRIVVMGHSAGGEATLLSLGLLPELFAAGVAMSAPSDRFTYWEETELAWARRLRYKLMGLPSARRELYIRRSAVTHVAAYRAPVLIIQGEDDPGVPAAQARQIADALKAAGKPHELVTYPGEGHYFSSAHAISDVARRIESFLAAHLPAKS